MTDRPPTNETELVEFIRSIEVPAPESLHRRVGALIAGRAPQRARTGRRVGTARRSYGLRPRLAAGGALLAAAIALAIAIGLGDGSSSELTVHDASALTLSPATAAAPRENPTNHTELAASVDGVTFPYWGERFGWHSTGTRVDHLDGRAVTTIFYSDGHGRRIGYAIVAGKAPPQPNEGVVSRRDGTPYRILTQHGAPVISWLRQGHLCVVSGHGVSGATLLRLASWDVHGTPA